MTTTPDGASLAAALAALAPKTSAPGSARVLEGWIMRAEKQLGADGGRLGWLVASTVVTAVLQQAVDEHDEPLFFVKGGTLLQHRLPRTSRATSDLDGLVRGDLDVFLETLNRILARPWGPFTLRRTEVEVIDVPVRVVKPRRFDVIVQVNGVTWRRIQVEISADEGAAGRVGELVAAPSLAGFGLPTPEHLTGLALRYQIAQKVHAVSDPHDPPDHINDRARDVVDLLLLRDLHDGEATTALGDVREAIIDIFAARADDAARTGHRGRSWPARVSAHPHWGASYTGEAASAGVTQTLTAAVADVNAWLDRIDGLDSAAGAGEGVRD